MAMLVYQRVVCWSGISGACAKALQWSAALAMLQSLGTDGLGGALQPDVISYLAHVGSRDHHWLVVSNMNFIFHFIYGMSSFPLTNSIIFQDGHIAPPTSYFFHKTI